MTGISAPDAWIRPPAPACDCVISKSDLETLLEGSETERERGHRNLFAGVAAVGALASTGTVVSHLGELLAVGLEPLESLFLTLTLAATLAAGILAGFFHRRVRHRDFDAARILGDQIREQLEHPADPADPRQWP